jgi:hypothetical protein
VKCREVDYSLGVCDYFIRCVDYFIRCVQTISLGVC